MADSASPLAPDHLPWFITKPGETDVLLIAMAVFLILVVMAVGNLYFQLHHLPERWGHKTSKIQVEIISVLVLLAMFTHNHLFWIAALLLALVQFPDFSTPIYSIADSLERLSGRVRTSPREIYLDAKPTLIEPAAHRAAAEGDVDERGDDVIAPADADTVPPPAHSDPRDNTKA